MNYLVPIEKKVWKNPCEASKLKHTVPTVRHGGDGIMLRVCYAASGVDT